MKTKKAIEILSKCETGNTYWVDPKDIDEALRAGKKALMCWLWMSKSVKAGLSDEEIMKVVRKGFVEAVDE
jgi:hypothetical protein